MENKHLNGLDQDLSRQTKEVKKSGGSGLKNIMERPEGNTFLYSGSNSMGKCNKCESQAIFNSFKNGKEEYRLCRDCFGKKCEKDYKKQRKNNGKKISELKGKIKVGDKLTYSEKKEITVVEVDENRFITSDRMSYRWDDNFLKNILNVR